ncbi:Hpt domain-containing protein [Paucibacter sediminis]|uniref:Hpt domain-containing protein n=1 Tax=Paucibacter sediminis TaxID=3019553 RepID=A0AA95SPP5_9BURK|nr:Hpt domain-containing protein [Paucibacter sp. S2-9]WIT13942.1 Hpt domain-containing protein [Paucibacter sp. S2-9]
MTTNTDTLCVDTGLRRCFGKASLYRQLLQRYLSQHATMPEQLADMYAREPALAARQAHSLISTAGSLGALGLCQLAAALEAAIEQGQMERTLALMQALALEHNALCVAAGRYLSAPHASP